jgi:hypothetical protein
MRFHRLANERLLGLVAVASMFAPTSMHAQQLPDTTGSGPRPQCLFAPTPECIFRASELSDPPRLIRMPMGLPPDLGKHAHDTVRVFAIIDTVGHVEPGSVRLLSTPDSALGAFAVKSVEGSVYQAGRTYGKAVRVKVIVPLVYTTP